MNYSDQHINSDQKFHPGSIMNGVEQTSVQITKKHSMSINVS